MEEKLYVIVGKRKKLARKIICKICCKEILVRRTVPHSGYCRHCWCKVIKAGTIDTSDLGGRKTKPKFEKICPGCNEKRIVYRKVFSPRLCKKCNARRQNWKEKGRNHPRLGTGNPLMPLIKKKKASDRKKELRKKLIKYFGNKCAKCGKENLPIRVFQFHHVKPKKYDMSFALKSNWSVVMEEAGKCIMVCANCHMIEHHGEERLMEE